MQDSSGFNQSTSLFESSYDEGATVFTEATASLRLQDLPIVPTLTDIIVLKYSGSKDDKGRFHGDGKAEFYGGHAYEGFFRKGMLHGQGKYCWADGLEYEGEFAFNEIRGRGVYRWPDGSSYEGEVQDGLRHGYGVYNSGKSEVSYEGDWSHGRRHGQGTLYFDRAHAAFYQGDWRHNRREGHGILQFASGNKYEGEWENDVKCGQGTMHWHTTAERYSGSWASDLPDGQGEHVWMEPPGGGGSTQKQMCNLYRGTWRAGVRSGAGDFLYANGAQYSGGWKDNKKHGNGIFIFDDGRIYAGRFEADHMCDYKPPAASAAAAAAAAPAPRIRLRVADLLPGGAGAEEGEGEDGAQAAALRDLEKLVLRHNAALKGLYRRFSSKTLDGFASSQGPESFALNLGQFWELCRACEIPGPTLPLAEINRIFYRMRRQHGLELEKLRREHLAGPGSNQEEEERAGTAGAPGGGGGVFCPVYHEDRSPHDPGRSLLFREYVELLVRVAAARFAGQGLPLAEAARRLLDDHVQYGFAHRGDAGGGGGSSAALAASLSSASLNGAAAGPPPRERLRRALWQRRDALLDGAYAPLAGRRGTLTHRRLLGAVAAAGLRARPAAGGGGGGGGELERAFDLPLAMEVFAGGAAAGLEGPAAAMAAEDFLCRELLFREFMEVLERVLDATLPRELFKPRPKPKPKERRQKAAGGGGRRRPKPRGAGAGGAGAAEGAPGEGGGGPEVPEEDPLEGAVGEQVQQLLDAVLALGAAAGGGEGGSPAVDPAGAEGGAAGAALAEKRPPRRPLRFLGGAAMS